MALLETVQGDREVLDGICPVLIQLVERVDAGAALAVISANKWGLSAHASGEVPWLIAGTAGEVDDYIIAYPMAIVKVTTATTAASTLGEVVALSDTGVYKVDAGNQPDVGFSAIVASDCSSVTMVLCPMIPSMDTPRT